MKTMLRKFVLEQKHEETGYSRLNDLLKKNYRNNSRMRGQGTVSLFLLQNGSIPMLSASLVSGPNTFASLTAQ